MREYVKVPLLHAHARMSMLVYLTGECNADGHKGQDHAYACKAPVEIGFCNDVIAILFFYQ